MGHTSFVLDDEGEEALLREALQTVSDQGFHLQRAVDSNDQSAVLKHTSEVLRELRTSLLSPKNYYQLYMQVMDELRHFENYVSDQLQAGTSMKMLYERVQSSGKVLPRLYLLVTVGAVYIKSQEAPVRDILKDLVEMTKGVQYPLRGLFLRHYLSLSVRDKLPDLGSVYEQSGGGTVSDSIHFLLQNLQATNQLWIRLQHEKSGRTRPLAVREKERLELQLLVGTSLVRLSQLEGVTLCVYTDQVLPRLVNEIVLASKDSMAQQYLMDCIIQVFPDEFHLETLEKLMNTMHKLQATVDVALLLTVLVERLIEFRQTQGNIQKANQEEDRVDDCDNVNPHNELFVCQQIRTTLLRLLLNSSRYPMPSEQEIHDEKSTNNGHVASVLSLFIKLTAFSLTWLDGRNLDTTTALQEIIAGCLNFLRERVTTWRDDKLMHQLVVSQLEALALVLLRGLSMCHLMQVPALMELIALMPWKGARKDVALAYIRVLLVRHERVYNDEQMSFLLQVLTPLIRDDPTEVQSPSPVVTMSPTQKQNETFEAEQHILAKIVHLVMNEDLDVKFRVYSIARRAFLQSGIYRIRFTLVPLIYHSLKLARDLVLYSKVAMQDQDHAIGSKLNQTKRFTTTPRQVLQFVHEMVTALASKHDAVSVSCVHLFLQCALIADGCAFESVAYEFITQAFIVYEDQITLARDQWQALELMVASLRATCNLSSANYETLATKTTQYAARLLKKKDQALMVLHCAHLFWHPTQHDGKRVRECLQRSLRIVDALQETTSTQVVLFLDILEAYWYFYEAQTPEVTQNYLVGLLALVKDHLANMEHGQMRREGEFRYRAIVRCMDASGFPDDGVSTSSSSSSR